MRELGGGTGRASALLVACVPVNCLMHAPPLHLPCPAYPTVLPAATPTAGSLETS